MTDDRIINTETSSYPTIKQAIGLTLFFLLFSVIAGVFIGVSTRSDEKDLLSLFYLIGYVVAAIFTINIGFSKFRKNKGATLRLKFNKPPLTVIVVGVIIVMTIPVIVDPINIILPMSESTKKMFSAVFNSNIFSILNIVIAAPVLEEILLRGIILDGLLKNYSPAKAIMASALIFGVMHLNPWQAIPAFLIGLLIGWMYWKTNSIIPGIILHFVNNLFATLVGLKFNTAETLRELMSLKAYIFLMTVSVIVIIAACLFLKQYFKSNSQRTELALEHVGLTEK